MKPNEKHTLALLLVLVLSIGSGGLWAAKIGGGGGGGGPAATWSSLIASGSIPTNEASRFSIRGNPTQTTTGFDLFTHSDGTPTIIPICGGTEYGCNTSVVIGSGQWREWADSSGNTIFRATPGGSGMVNKLTYGANYRPLKSVWFDAGSLKGDGTQCPADPSAVTINSGPKVLSFICADNNGSVLYGEVPMPANWDGGTVTFTHHYIQTAADTNVLEGAVSCQSRAAGVAPSSTWGTAIDIDDAAVTGSNAEDRTTSAAVTCAGSPAGGDTLYFRYVLSGTNTTTAAASLHHRGFWMTYTTTSPSH